MSDAEKVKAFDSLATVLTNRFTDGTLDWLCPTACGGNNKRATQAEAVADLVAWAAGLEKWAGKRHGRKLP